MPAHIPTDVLVVGAGPVGLLAALTLARRGARVVIIDEAWRTAAHSYALALHAQTVPLLADAGVRGAIAEQGRTLDTLAVYDGSVRRASWPLADAPAVPGIPGGAGGVVALRQDVFEAVLEERLGALGVRVLWNHRLVTLASGEDAVIATIDRLGKSGAGYAVAAADWAVEGVLSVDARFVIAADGHRSTVRRLLDIEWGEAGPAQAFAVFELTTPKPLPNELALVLAGGRTHALWPLPSGSCRWSFDLGDAAQPMEERHKNRWVVQLAHQTYPLLLPEHLTELIQEHAPWFDAPVAQLHWSTLVRFEHRLARRFGAGRCWLAGDAAHQTGPLGGQSMNVGLREAATLAGRMVDILQKQAALDTLEQYGDAQHAEWSGLLGLTGGPVADDRTDSWLRDQRGALLGCLPASGEDLVRLLRHAGFGPPPGA